jgi:TldD protein
MSHATSGFFADRYGIDPKVMNDLLGIALSRGGTYADLYFEHRTTSSILFEEQSVKSANGGVIQGVGIRVVAGDATGYAYSEDLSFDAMRRAAETAAKIAAGGGSTQAVNVSPRQPADLYRVRVPSWETPAREKLEIIRRADAAARGYDPMIRRAVVTFADELKHVAIAGSDGTFVEDQQPMLRLVVQCLSEQGNERQTAVGVRGGRVGMEYFETQTPEDFAHDVARQAVLLQSAIDAPAGTMPVVLGAGDSGVLLHEAIGHGLEADFNRKKTSNYTDQLGHAVAASNVTVIDDGTVPNSRGSINVDDEGNLPKKNVLIEEGVLAQYMQDRISARHFGVEASGNGRRESFQHYPMPRMTNTYMLPGESSPDDIIKSVDKGLYCLSYSGGQVNISNGDFVFSVTEAYMIEDGKVTVPVKGVTLIGNGPDTLSRITMVGNDFRLAEGGGTCGKDGQSVPVGLGMPSVLVSGITVGGTKA